MSTIAYENTIKSSAFDLPLLLLCLLSIRYGYYYYLYCNFVVFIERHLMLDIANALIKYAKHNTL